MKIALDFDGVLSHTTKSWVRFFNIKYSGNLTTRDIEEWDSYKSFGLNIDECMELFKYSWSDWEHLDPLEQDLYQKTKMLRNIGQLDIVTSSNPKVEEYLSQWLKKHDVRYDNLVFSDHKYDLDYTVFIDDSPYNALELTKQSKLCLLYNQPWNRHVQNNTYRKRIYNLYYAIDVIRHGD